MAKKKAVNGKPSAEEEKVYLRERKELAYREANPPRSEEEGVTVDNLDTTTRTKRGRKAGD